MKNLHTIDRFVRAIIFLGINFVFAASPDPVNSLSPSDSEVRNIHMNRGDWDGPIHLLLLSQPEC